MSGQDLQFDSLKLFYSAVLDALTANIAVIDSQGTILMVNEAWRRFGGENNLRDDEFCVGTNYLDVCDAAKLDPDARQATSGIRSVLSGSTDEFHFDYSCDSPWEKRRFHFSATAITGFPQFAVVSHERLRSAPSETTTPKDKLNVLGAAELTARLADMKAADIKQVTTVCAWCDAVKIEHEDRAYWHIFSAGTGDLLVSHGICPSCHEKLAKHL